jgi:acetylornithine deacetylase/succinyl-diaminopimelate desuccinylase-like protein
MKTILRASAIMPLATLLLTSSIAWAQDDQAEIEAAKNTLIHSIAIPTVLGRGRVPELAAYYAGIFKKAGFADSDIVITTMGETATLEVTLRGRESSSPAILLSGHMDVVEADPADWERDPFTPVEENGYLFGRGSFDNKFGVAMMITTLVKLKKEGYRPRQDVVLLLSGDEETSMVTTKALAEKYRGAEMVLNGDGGGGVLSEDNSALYYSLQAAEKTYVDFQLEFTNPGGHSSRPSKPNAITQLADALSNLGAYEFPPQMSELTRASLQGMAAQVDPELGAYLLRIVENPDDAEALAAIRSNPEYIGQIGTTCVATMVNAGHAQNALPQRATANINCRVFPGVSMAEVQAELSAVVGDPAGKFTVLDEPSMSPASPLREDITDAVADAVHASYQDLPIIPGMSAYGTDSTHFRAAGIPSYGVSGLFVRPEDDFTHGLNERVPVASIPVALVHWDILIRTITR